MVLCSPSLHSGDLRGLQRPPVPSLPVFRLPDRVGWDEDQGWRGTGGNWQLRMVVTTWGWPQVLPCFLVPPERSHTSLTLLNLQLDTPTVLCSFLLLVSVFSVIFFSPPCIFSRTGHRMAFLVLWLKGTEAKLCPKPQYYFSVCMMQNEIIFI